MIAENAQNVAAKGKGAAKRGPALLFGLLRCKRCGRKLMVGYTGREKNVLRYFCRRGHLDTGEAKCINFSGDLVDIAVVREVLRVIKPAGIDAAYQAWHEYRQQEDQVVESLELELQQARYLSQRAWKQYNSADPENRLVAAELEKRWNDLLEQVRLLEQKIDNEKNRRQTMTMPGKQDFLALSDKFAVVWDHPATDVKLKKRIIRTLIGRFPERFQLRFDLGHIAPPGLRFPKAVCLTVCELAPILSYYRYCFIYTVRVGNGISMPLSLRVW